MFYFSVNLYVWENMIKSVTEVSSCNLSSHRQTHTPYVQIEYPSQCWYWPLIGQYVSRDLNTGPWLADAGLVFRVWDVNVWPVLTITYFVTTQWAQIGCKFLAPSGAQGMQMSVHLFGEKCSRLELPIFFLA